MKNLILDDLKAGKSLVGTLVGISNPDGMECLALAGVDFAFIDTEHGYYHVAAVADLIRAARVQGMAPFVRVKDGARSSILEMLNIGVQTLVIPNIHTVDQARDIVEFGKYAPLGQRGFSFMRCSSWGEDPACQDMSEYFHQANQEVLLLPQCETQGALDHIEEIVALEGIGGIFIGPNDLLSAMGIAGQFQNPAYIAAVERIIKACKDHGKYCFSYAANAEKAKEYFAQGIQCVAVGSDSRVLIAAYKSMLQSLKG